MAETRLVHSVLDGGCDEVAGRAGWAGERVFLDPRLSARLRGKLRRSLRT